MTTTLATMQSNIASYLKRSDLSTQVALGINRAIQYYASGEHFLFQETSAVFNTIIGQLTYGAADGVPTDVLSIDNLNIQQSTTVNYPLTPRTLRYITERNVANIKGVPSDFAFYAGSFLIYPNPDKVYPLTLSYIKNYADLVNGSDNNDFTNNVPDLIEARAIWWIYERILRNDTAAAAAKQDELDLYVNSMAATQAKVTSRHLRPTKF